MNEMFAPLSGDELAIARKTTPKTRTKAAIVPVPDDAPPMAFRHPKHGAPAHVWPYHEAQGRRVGYVCRWDFTDAADNPAKEILPVTFCDLGNGHAGLAREGHSGAAPALWSAGDPRPARGARSRHGRREDPGCRGRAVPRLGGDDAGPWREEPASDGLCGSGRPDCHHRHRP
ncbi:hypothetical protein ACRC7T_10115 [Segnochrobactraceae bacterium EtOH-i3]